MALMTRNMKLPSGLSVPGSSFIHSLISYNKSGPVPGSRGVQEGKQAQFPLASSFQASGKTCESNNPTKEGIIKH